MVNRTWLREIREARAEGIKTAYEAGETNLTRLAARFDCSRDTIRRSLGVHGIIPNPHRLKSYVNPAVLKPSPQVIRPYTIPDHFGVLPPTPFEQLKEQVSEIRAKVTEIEGKLAALESRMPVFTWTPNTTAAQPYWQTFTVNTVPTVSAETTAMMSPTGGVIQVEI